MKTVIYARISTTNQDLDSQINACIKFAEYKEFKEIEVFKEQISGTTTASTRVEYDKMINFIKENEIKNVITFEISRFGRNITDVLNNIKYFKENKIQVFFVKEGFRLLDDDGKT
jgi:DNA invertase Pin-like site-specific DNA recombinase